MIIKTAGVIFFVVGLLFAGWSLLIFRKAHTTTTPGESSKKLVMTGPYLFSRNPMYVSLTLAYLGESGLLVQALPILTLLFVLAYVNWVVIPLEEEVLKGDFKDEYEKYCSHVRRWI
jgi:protein-S-isoprenylcysteine O-methyltransferase Ste14